MTIYVVDLFIICGLIAQHMLWEIADTPHRLLGSMHILPEETMLPNWVTASYGGIERFVFESSPGSPHQIGIDQTRAHLDLSGVLEVYQRAKMLLASIGSNEPFDAFLPWRTALYIVIRFLPILGLSPAHGIENRFQKMRVVVEPERFL